MERCGIVGVRLLDTLSKAIPSVDASTPVANYPTDIPSPGKASGPAYGHDMCRHHRGPASVQGF